jgi:hypothetical protein
MEEIDRFMYAEILKLEIHKYPFSSDANNGETMNL